MTPISAIKLFESKKVRSVWDTEMGKWYFSIIDVVEILTDSPNPRDYWYRVKQREKISGIELSTICRQFKLAAQDGKLRETDCSDTEGLLRIIQSIPSPKAEPFKRWLAKVGYERLEEIENPELAAKRMRELYKAKGYSDEWIEKRVRGIAIRDELTDEWRKRGVKEQKEYSILTAEISRATFGMTPSEYKEFKGLEKQRDNLRDHMTDLELIFTMPPPPRLPAIAMPRSLTKIWMPLLKAAPWPVAPGKIWSGRLASGFPHGIISRKFRRRGSGGSGQARKRSGNGR